MANARICGSLTAVSKGCRESAIVNGPKGVVWRVMWVAYRRGKDQVDRLDQKQWLGNHGRRGTVSEGSGAAPGEVCGAELATDEGWLGRAQFQAGAFELRYVVLGFADPVGEEADHDVVGDLAVVGDGKGA